MTTNKLTLLAVLAHPDDESFGMGGTLALYAARGVAVHLICATRGEAGTLDADCLDGYDSVAERRVSELQCAAGVLGLTGVHYLDYRDSGMTGSPDNIHPDALAAQPLEEVAARVALYIRRLRPQVVVTFDPIGGYKHPDHIAIHKATVRAFDLAADPGFHTEEPLYCAQKLYFQVIPKGLLKFAIRAMRLFGRDPHKFGRNGDIDIVDIVRDGDFPIHAAIDFSSVADKKQAAAACHESQLGGMPRQGLMGKFIGWLGRREQFMRAYPPVKGRVREDDLFAEVG